MANCSSRWGYTTIWNMLDYPSIIMPVKHFKINAADDPKDVAYEPRVNPFDGQNWELCTFVWPRSRDVVLMRPSLDDPELWKTQPMTLQIVGRPYRDEALIANCELLDDIINR